MYYSVTVIVWLSQQQFAGPVLCRVTVWWLCSRQQPEATWRTVCTLHCMFFIWGELSKARLQVHTNSRCCCKPQQEARVQRSVSVEIQAKADWDKCQQRCHSLGVTLTTDKDHWAGCVSLSYWRDSPAVTNRYYSPLSPSLARSQSVANKHSAGEDMHVANMFLHSDNADSTFSFFKKGISVSTVQIHSTWDRIT